MRTVVQCVERHALLYQHQHLTPVKFKAGIDDTLIARAIVTGLLPRERIPAELLEALQPILAFYERERSEPGQDSA